MTKARGYRRGQRRGLVRLCARDAGRTPPDRGLNAWIRFTPYEDPIQATTINDASDTPPDENIKEISGGFLAGFFSTGLLRYP
jgi:hypothetical protein